MIELERLNPFKYLCNPRSREMIGNGRDHVFSQAEAFTVAGFYSFYMSQWMHLCTPGQVVDEEAYTI